MKVPMFDDYTAATEKSVPEAAAAVAAAAAARGFDVLQALDLGKVFAEKGFPSPRAVVVEVCFAQFGSMMLEREPQSCLMMPCRIGVYESDGKTRISALRPRLVGEFFPDLAPMAEQGDALMREIVDTAK